MYRNNLPLAKFSIMYETAALSEFLCFLVSITTACSLLPVFNCLYPIFTFVLVPCKFTVIAKSLSLHWACLHSCLSLAQECVFEVNPLFTLYVSFWFTSQRSCIMYKRFSVWNLTARGPPTMHPLHWSLHHLHQLLLPTHPLLLDCTTR